MRRADISYASLNPRGKGDFVIVRPADKKRLRHAALIEVPNRAFTQANGFFFTTAAGASFERSRIYFVYSSTTETL